MIIKKGLRSPSNRDTASCVVASAQSTRCWLRRLPHSHKSPSRDTGFSGNGGATSACSSVVSSSWVQASLAEQSHVDNTGYGYFWWRPWLNVETPNGPQHVDMSAAQGNGGQKIYLLPQYDLIAVFTAGDYNSEGAPPNKIMANIILPALISARSRNAASSPLK